MLTDIDIVRVWERGEPHGPVERALALLGGGFPDRASAELAELSIGQRDALLLRLREQTFGGVLRGVAECAACGQAVIFSTTCAELSLPMASTDWPLTVPVDGFVLRIRPPNSRDLAAAAAAGELMAARRELFLRCVLSAQRGDEPLLAQELPPPLLAAVIAALVEHEPQAEVRLTLRCSAPACGNTWQALFDIATYLWAEVAVKARRLFHEVDVLAQAYGWREADILAMSAVRRQQYLNLRGA